MHSIAIAWFRNDLRLSDNPALLSATTHDRVLPIYILDDGVSVGSASGWWLYRSLIALDEQLDGCLNVYRGNAVDIIAKLISKYSVRGIYWNRCYEPYAIEQEREVEALGRSSGVECVSFNGSVLWEPSQILNKEGSPYKVFTHFYRNACNEVGLPRIPFGKPEHLDLVVDDDRCALNRPLSNLAPARAIFPQEKWHGKLEGHCVPGEKSAVGKLNAFIEGKLQGYRKLRDYPGLDHVSMLSPHLHYGEISVHQVWHASVNSAFSGGEDAYCFQRELAWREFSYYLLYHFPLLPSKSFRSKFDDVVWHNDVSALEAWRRGRTGYPLVDAGMRQLWQTGYMHNRVRMVVGSFLVKNLLIDWRLGAEWFLNCLVDADLASNSTNWQWVAGCGVDAAPYFRVFNPVLQAKKFDADGVYVKRFVPELQGLPTKYIYEPWRAPTSALEAAGVILGETYPYPIVDLSAMGWRMAFSKFTQG